MYTEEADKDAMKKQPTEYESYVVLVPKVDAAARLHIDAGSAIVTDKRQMHTELITVSYESNRYDAENLRTFEAKVHHAADRLVRHYPTVARGVFAADDFVDVGSFIFARDWSSASLTVIDEVTLAQWLGAHYQDPRLSAAIFKQRVPCSDCPFRKEGGVRHPEAMMASYIAYHVTTPGVTFPCHKSVEESDTRETWSAWQNGQVLCAGGLLFAAKQGKENNVMRFGRECGWYDPVAQTPEERALVFDSVDEMLDAAKED